MRGSKLGLFGVCEGSSGFLKMFISFLEPWVRGSVSVEWRSIVGLKPFPFNSHG